MEESKPLPTLKSLAKENKKLQRLLKISMAQRSQNPITEGVAGPVHISDTSLNNLSVCSELRINSSLGVESPRTAELGKGADIHSSLAKSSTKLGKDPPPGLTKKTINHRS